MTIARMVELLAFEHACMLRNSHGDCDRRCENCNLVQDDGELHEMYTDVIALLKAQEPVEPYGMYSEHMGTKWLACGACDFPMVKITPNAIYPNYCPECGRAVKWE